jgi:VCBS repeat-containing protein
MGVMRGKLKRFFYFFSLGILCVFPLSSFISAHVVSDPVASNVLNFLIQNISGRSQILPLIGNDTDGTIVSFRILSLPNTAAGDLYLNNVPVTINQTLTPAEAKQLQFEVKSTFTTGNATFTYTVTDNDGLTDSTPATFTIPVTNNGALLVCTGGGLSTNILGASGTFSAPYITANPTISCINNGSTVASPLGNLGNAVSGLTTYNYASTSNSLGPEGTYSFLKTLGTMAVRNCIKTDWVASDHTGDGGYAMIVNGSPNSNTFGKTFYQASSISVCPNTLYEFSAYVINILPGNHAAATPGSEPNISFYINGQLVSTSGAIAYATASDNFVPQWVKVGGLWYSGPNTSVNLKIDNATFVAGGNDLGLDDISMAICGPEISYPNISLTPQFCSYGVLPLNAEVKASINTYSSYIFQLSTDGGNIWSDMGAAKTGNPVYDALTNSYVYTAAYGDIPIDPSMNGYRYRLKVATDSPNLTGTTCNVSADKVITVSAFNKPVAGADIVSCNAISSAALVAAQGGETWSASASNPSLAVIGQNGQVSGMSANGIYEFYLANAAGCVDTVKIARSEVQTAGSDAVVCSDQTSYKFADAPAGYEWQLVSGNPSAATIDPNTGYVSDLGINGDYQFQLVSKIAPCTDIVKLTKGVCPKINFRASTSSFSENAGTVTVEVYLDQASTLAVSVPYTLGSGTATNTVDFTSTTGNLIFNAGETSKMITVNLIEDNTIEPDETVVFDLGAPVNASLGTIYQHTLTILNDDAAICISPDAAVRNEGNPGSVSSTAYTFKVSRSTGSFMGNAVSFSYQLSSLPGGFDAADLLDLTELNKVLNATIPAGQNSVILTYLIKPDIMMESDDPFKVTITAADPGIAIDCQEAQGIVLNDDLNKTIIQFETITSQTPEAAVNVLLKVILSTPSPKAIDVPFYLTDITTTNDMDYANILPAARLAHFNAGDEEAFINITIKEDTADEPDESMSVTLTDPGEAQFVLGSQITHTITIIDDDPIVVQDDFFNTNEDTPLSNTVKTNDYDPGGDPLTFTMLTGPQHGQIQFNANGTFIYTPAPDYFGNDSFTYRGCNVNNIPSCGTAAVYITVVPVNDPPVAGDDVFTGAEDVVITGSVIANDSDPDGDVLTYTRLTIPSKGTLVFNSNGSFTYTPDADSSGTDTFSYRACDPSGFCDIAEVTLRITPVNDPPKAKDDLFIGLEDSIITATVALNDTDPDGNMLAFTRVTNPSHGTLAFNADGTFTYSPELNFNGTDRFTYRACDPSGACDQAEVLFIVNPVNDPPQAVNDAYQTTEDISLKISAPGIMINDSDPEGDRIFPILRDKAAKGDIFINQDGSFTYNPYKNLTGEDQFTYVVNDGFLNSNVARVKINIIAQNDPPEALDDNFRTSEDIFITGTVATNDSDAENDPLVFTIVSTVAHGQLIFKADGSFIYTPEKNYNGQDKFTYRVCDPSGGCDQAQVLITVDPQNDPPVAVDDNFKTPEDINLTGNVAPNDSDPEGDQLTFTLVTSPAHGQVVVKTDGSFIYTPQNNYNGTDKFVYKVCDVSGACAQATATITIVPVNDAPVAVNDTYQTPIGSPLQVKSSGVLTNDSDPDNDKITAILISNPSHGKITLNADGSFLYIPDKYFQGEESFTYVANDGVFNSNTARVIINIPGNSASALTGIVSLTPTRSQISEGESISITAELSNELAEDLIITLGYGGTAMNTIDAEDYHLTGNFVTIRIPAGQTKTTEKFTVEALPDDLKEGDEFLDARITSVSSLNAIIGTGAQVTIKDIYPPVAVIKRELPPNTDILPDPLFSPNGDGKGNEVFNILNIGLYPENEVAIFNRWGNEVFRIKGYDNGMNAFKGRANRGLLSNTSTDLVDGVYYYMIYSISGQERKLNKGYVILKR